MPNLICPIDKKELIRKGNSYSCSNNHCYDIAKQGYVNLLLPQQKNSRSPGDSKEMVIARQLFLNSESFIPIAEQIQQIVINLQNTKENTKESTKENTINNNQLKVLDAGCGEGYYLDYICQNTTIDCENFYGLDISKPAVLASSKKNKNINWLVASNVNIPFADNSFDIIFCIFGFACFDEFKRVLKPNGKLVMIEPEANHLLEMREIIYPLIKQKAEKKLEITDFKLINSKILDYKKTINKEQISNLIVMTPHFYRATKENRAKLEILDKITITINTIINTYSLDK